MAGRETPNSTGSRFEDPYPAPPSVSRTGRLHSGSCPSLTPFAGPAENVRTLKNVNMQRAQSRNEAMPKALWSDGLSRSSEEQWPAHAVPLFVFDGQDRPRPAYREEVRFMLHDERYVNVGLRLKCGTGDRYMGGSVGLVHSPDRMEASPGTEGQLVMITDIIVNPDNSVLVSAIGDLNFHVLQSWMPRGLRGLQLAFVEVEPPSVPLLRSLPETCAGEPGLRLFARLLDAMPSLAQTLMSAGPFTAFVPTDAGWGAALGQADEQDLVARPDLEALLRCHVCGERVPHEAMYSGRSLQALDGTVLTVTFARWPRGGPRVNEIPIEQMDIQCSNGVIHAIAAPLSPAPMIRRRGGR